MDTRAETSRDEHRTFVEPARWLDPTPSTSNSPRALREEHVRSWREAGFCLLDGVLPADLIDRARADAERVFPAPGSDAAGRMTDFGGRGQLVFPVGSDALNEITLHPRLLRAVADLLDTDVVDLRLTQSNVWPKYERTKVTGPYDNIDQRIHCDYPNHTLLHPPRWDRPEAVEMIVYFDDEARSGGGTAVVPRTGPDDPAYPWPITRMPGVAGLRWQNDRTIAEAELARVAPEIAKWRAEHLYAREAHVRFRPGTVLFYRHDTWHRGTPLRPGSGVRYAQNLTIRRAAAGWVSVLHSGWAWSMYHPGEWIERILGRGSIDQLAVLGVPPPGNAYWTPETIEAVEARYAPYGMDLSAHRAAL